MKVGTADRAIKSRARRDRAFQLIRALVNVLGMMNEDQWSRKHGMKIESKKFIVRLWERVLDITSAHWK
jgi:hypothetical protein